MGELVYILVRTESNFFVKDFSSNKHVHTHKIHKILENVRNSLLYTQNVEQIWEMSKSKFVYKILIDKRKVKPIIENKYMNCNWQVTWKRSNTENNITNKDML